ncbi:hypothetical protein [Desulfonatronum parangueonense]
MKFPMRIYGHFQGFDQEKQKSLQRELDPDVFVWHGNDRLEVEYEGKYLDMEPDLDLIASALAEHGQGHVDSIDHESWIVSRYQIRPGSWTCKQVDPDGTMEKYHHE